MGSKLCARSSLADTGHIFEETDGSLPLPSALDKNKPSVHLRYSGCTKCSALFDGATQNICKLCYRDLCVKEQVLCLGKDKEMHLLKAMIGTLLVTMVKSLGLKTSWREEKSYKQQ